jgi:hypothetical protein
LALSMPYPKDPKTLGEHIRTARMDRGWLINDLAALIGTTEDTVINRELRGVKPTLKRDRQRLVECLAPEVYDGAFRRDGRDNQRRSGYCTYQEDVIYSY